MYDSSHLFLRICGRNKRIVELLKRILEKCRKYANKYLAHKDLDHATGVKKTDITRKSTTDAIKAIGLFVKEFHSLTQKTEYVLMPISPLNDVRQFLARLNMGNIASKEIEKKRKEQARNGENFDPMEGRWPDWIHCDAFTGLSEL